MHYIKKITGIGLVISSFASTMVSAEIYHVGEGDSNVYAASPPLEIPKKSLGDKLLHQEFNTIVNTLRGFFHRNEDGGIQEAWGLGTDRLNGTLNINNPKEEGSIMLSGAPVSQTYSGLYLNDSQQDPQKSSWHFSHKSVGITGANELWLGYWDNNKFNHALQLGKTGFLKLNNTLSFGDYGLWSGANNYRNWLGICDNDDCNTTDIPGGKFFHISGVSNPEFGTVADTINEKRVIGLFDEVVIPQGNLGIGTTFPTQRLDIDGKIRMRLQTDEEDDGDIVATKDYVDAQIDKLTELISKLISTEESDALAGYTTIYTNLDEDYYSENKGRRGESCDQFPRSKYTCRPEENRSCVDEYIDTVCEDEGCMSFNASRDVQCTAAKVLVNYGQTTETLFAFSGYVDSRAEITLTGTELSWRSLDQWRGLDHFVYKTHAPGPATVPNGQWKVVKTGGVGSAVITYHDANVLKIELNDDGGPGNDYQSFKIVRK